MSQLSLLTRAGLFSTCLGMVLWMGGCGWEKPGSEFPGAPPPPKPVQSEAKPSVEKTGKPVKMADGMLAHLPFDDAKAVSNGVDATEHFRYTLTNGRGNLLKESVVPGLFGKALQCDGRTYVSIPDLAPDAINRENQGAISVWFYANAEQASPRAVIVSLTNGWGLDLSLRDYTVWNALNIFYTSPDSEGGVPSLQVVNSCRQQTLDDNYWWTTSWGADGARCSIRLDKKYPCSPNQWHHVVVNGGNQGWQIYLDGKLVQKGAETTWLKKGDLPKSNEAPIKNGEINTVLIGASHTGCPWDNNLRYDNFFWGKIDDFCYYGRNLRAEEVETLYKKGKALDVTSTQSKYEGTLSTGAGLVSNNPATNAQMTRMAQDIALLRQENFELKSRISKLEQKLK